MFSSMTGWLDQSGEGSLNYWYLITILYLECLVSPTLIVFKQKWGILRLFQCLFLCVRMFFRILLWPGGENRWGGRANLLWRRGCYSEGTETLAECQDLTIQSPQRRKDSVGVYSASFHILAVFLWTSFWMTTNRVSNCILFMISLLGSLWIPED